MFFCDICRHFEASIGFCFSKVVNLVKFIILALFATFVRGVLRTKHTLMSNCIKFYFNSFNWHTPCYSCDFCGICRHFGVSLAFFFSTILLHSPFRRLSYHEKFVLLLQVLRAFRGSIWLLLFRSRESCYISYSWDICKGYFRKREKSLLLLRFLRLLWTFQGPS